MKNKTPLKGTFERQKITHVRMKILGITILYFILFTGLKVYSVNYFEQAVEEIEEMLSGNKQLSFKRAVFLAENAFYDGELKLYQYTPYTNSLNLGPVNRNIINKVKNSPYSSVHSR